MEALAEFIKTNWRLIYTAYRAHPNSCQYILSDFPDGDEGFTCYFAPYLWVDLFCERDRVSKIGYPVPPPPFTWMEPGHLYVCEGSCHHFTLVFIDEATVIYTDYYQEARGIPNAYRVSMMTGDEAREVLAIMQRGNVHDIITFHGAAAAEKPKRFEREVRGGLLRVGVVRKYPIVRTPTLATLVEVCRTAGDFDDDDIYQDMSCFPPPGRELEYEQKWFAYLCRLSMLC